MPAQQQDPNKITRGEALAIIYLAAGSHAACITPFIRSGVGSEAFGIKAVFAMVGMAMFTEGKWLSGMGIYLIAWFLALVYRRVQSLRNWLKGDRVHSRYIGWPWLAMKFIKDPSGRGCSSRSCACSSEGWCG